MNITGDQLTDLMISICWLSVLLLIGKYIRVKVALLQKLFLPASIIAGFIGFILGPYIFGKYVVEVIPASTMSMWAMFPVKLINIVFACLFLGVAIPALKTIWREGGPQFCYGWLVGMGQYVVGLGLGVLVLTPLFGVPDFFGCLLEIGFSGGPATAAAMQDTFHKLGFPAGADLGLMSGTIGIVCAVVFGMALVNLAVRKGYTTIIKDPKGLSSEDICGLIPEGKRTAGSFITISPDALEPFAFHAAIIGLSILFGYFGLLLLQSLSAGMEIDLFKRFPLFPLAMLGGLVVQILATKTGLSKYFDKSSFERIQGVASDFLVVSAIASIKLDVLLTYFWPFALLMLFGLAWVILTAWYVAPRMFPDTWFERGITEYGMQTGVTAIGLLLLRVTDPNYETPALKSFGFKQFIYEPLLGGGLITVLTPFLIVDYGVWPVIFGAIGTILIFLTIAFFNGWIHKRI